MTSVPRERLAAIIERVLPEYGGDLDDAKGVGRVPQAGPLESMAEEIARTTGQKRATVLRRLYEIRCGKPAPHNPTFKTADNILSALGLTHLWHTELADLYEEAA